MSDVRTVKLKFSDLVFLEDNPRTITRDKLERLAERIRKDPTFFENRPCLVNYTGGQYVCYGGFQRSHAAAKILKWKEVPCSVENDIPTELMRERAILDNTHDGDWDSDVLANWEFDIPELREMGVPEFVFGEVQSEENGEIDYSEKNKELDTDGFFDEMEMKFKFSKDDFMDVQERLNVVCSKQNVETKEDALRELLMFYERHGS